MKHVATVVDPTASPADLDRRFHAFVLDRLLAAAAAGVGCAGSLLLAGVDRLGAALATAVAALLLAEASLAALVGLHGTTPGGGALGIRVVSGGGGTPIGVGPALLRQLVLVLAGAPTFGLGIATLAWTAAADPTGRRQGWHDRAVGSVVLDVRPVPGPAPEPEPVAPYVVNLTARRLVPAHEPEPVPASSAAPEAAGSTVVRQPQPVDPARPARPAPTEQPARWRVGVDSGETFLVEGLALVGRRPEARPGEPVRHLVALPSQDMSMSKTHLQLQVAADGVLVALDRGSTNGSVLIRRGAARALAPGQPATLLDGDRVRLGDRELRVSREP